MLVKDVKIENIKQLLNSLPDDLIIDSIDLTNGYEIRLRASQREQEAKISEDTFNELLSIIKKLEK